MYSLAKLLAEGHHTTNIIAALLNNVYGRATDISKYGTIEDLYDRSSRPSTRRPARKPGREQDRAKREQKAKGQKKGKRKANTSRFKSIGK